MNLDDTDLRILQLLQADGRTSRAAIGEAVGMTGPSVYARIKRLEDEGIIRAYTVHLDPKQVGQGLLAFVRVLTQSVPLAQEGDFERYMLSEPRVLECHDTDGEDSYLVKVRVGSLEELRELVNEIRAKPTVVRTVTSVAMVTVKESGLTAPVVAR